MDSSYGAPKPTKGIARKALFLCLGSILLTHIAVAGQKTALLLDTPSHGQRTEVTVDFNKVPLVEVLQELARKVDVGISYKTEAVPARMVTYRAKKVSVYRMLDAVLKGTGLQASLSENHKVILIKQKQVLPAVQQETVSGTVSDASSGRTLPGVNIRLKGTSTGTATGGDGQYSLTVESLQDTLVFSFVGYQSQTVPINGRSSIDVALKASTQNLEEMVVVGFGQQQKRRKVIGAVSNIKAEDLRSSFNTTVDKSLQGKTAGVQVTSTSGVLGAPVKLRVRGTTSINANSQPLYVIDGMPIVGSDLGQNLGVEGGGGINPLINLNSNNIESIEVLKDASSSAIFGSRGANGVVLITTKSGSPGKTKINVNLSGGFNEPTDRYNLLNTSEYIDMYNYRTGKNLKSSDYENTDWMDIVTRKGSIQNYSASVSGGDKNTQFFINGLYSRKEGFARPNEIKKTAGRVTVKQKFNNKFHLGVSLAPSRTNNNRIQTSNSIAAPYSLGVLDAPLIPKFYPNGDVNDGLDSDRAPGNAFAGFPSTPYVNLLGSNINSETNQILGYAKITYDIIPELSLKTNFGFQFLQNLESFRYGEKTYPGYPEGTSENYNQQYTDYNWRTTLNYRRNWTNNTLKILFGTSFERNEGRSLNVSGSGFVSDQLKTLNSAASITGGGGSNAIFAYQNNIVNLSYDYKDRYLLTVTGNYQGTSRFPKDIRYGFFPSVAVGWRISDESFAGSFKNLSNLKLRLSYGITGNSNIGNYPYQAQLDAGANYAGDGGIHLAQLASPNLTWEKTAQWDVGINYGFLNSRISGSVDYYHKHTTDLLLALPVSNTNGFTKFTKNIGGLVNRGLEFEISANIFQGAFLWSVNANISTLHNEVKSLGSSGDIINAASLARVGEPLASYYLPEYKGVNPENGDALFADGNGGVTPNFNKAPRKLLGDPFPNYYGGFGTKFSYKGFDANIDFQFSHGSKAFWFTGAYISTNLSGIYNQTHSQFDYWTPNNRNASIPEPRSTPNGNQSYTSRYLDDASYLRLKNASIGYTLPKSMVKNKLRLYVQGTNLLTIDNYMGLDPEVTPSTGSILNSNVYNFLMLPQARSIIFGIQVGI